MVGDQTKAIQAIAELRDAIRGGDTGEIRSWLAAVAAETTAILAELLMSESVRPVTTDDLLDQLYRDVEEYEADAARS